MEPDFFPRAHPPALSGAFHHYVRGVFADRSAHAPRLHQARALWLGSVAQRTTCLPRPPSAPAVLLAI
jgi:hypothetical protein